jgi:hypothetical protein
MLPHAGGDPPVLEKNPFHGGLAGPGLLVDDEKLRGYTELDRGGERLLE